MKYNKQLDNYLSKNFMGLQLKSPLFYNTPVAIRFELGGNLESTKGRAAQVNKRVVTLFRELNRSSDAIYVVMFVDSWDEHPIASFEKQVHHIFQKYISGMNHNQLDMEEKEFRYKDPDESDDTVTIRYCIKVKVKDLNAEGLLEALTNRGIGIQPTIIGDIFLVNETKNTIFHFYDDRGLDIAAKGKDALRNIYEKYNNWILDYDRNKVDKIFY
jgi:hypothetical protein